ETPRFVAIDKPAGMVTHPTATAYRNTALLYLQLNGWPDAAVVHRIDRDTSGVLLFARGAEAARALSQAFEEGLMTKTYLALVVDARRRHVVGESGHTDQPLGFNVDSALPTLEVGVGDWTCATHWTCVARQDDLALLEVTIDG